MVQITLGLLAWFRKLNTLYNSELEVSEKKNSFLITEKNSTFLITLYFIRLLILKLALWWWQNSWMQSEKIQGPLQC